MRASVGVLRGAAPAAAAAAAAARSALPLPAAPVGAGPRLVWLGAAALTALKGKVRLQAQLALSALSLAAACAAAGHDALRGDPAARGNAAAAALLCVVGAEALHCGLVYLWDDHLRAHFLRERAGGAPPHAPRPHAAKAKSA
jgi:hypothetical protein